jgi:arylsulfatase A-like enzyme
MPDRPNVLWLVLEDVSPDFGCYGGPDAVATPNIDRLAADGLRFTNAYATSPTCSPSRSALATGMYQTSIGAHHQRCHQSPDAPEPPNPLPDGVRVIADWFRDAGYYTANLTDFPTDIEVSGKLDWNFTYRGEPFDTEDWTDLPGNEPFFAQVCFSEVHRPWTDSPEELPSPATPEDAELPPYYPDHPAVREDFAGYYNTVMAGDQKVGVILDTLEAAGLLEETVVVLTADHGRPMLRAKQQPYDTGLNVPLVVRWPDEHPAPAGYESGAVDDRLLAGTDITATTLSAAGVGVPDAMHGRPLFGEDAVERAYVVGAVDRVAEVPGRRRTVRTRRYRYVRNYHPGRPWLRENRYALATREVYWAMRERDAAGDLDPVQRRYLSATKPPEELYDLREDPHQVDNVAGDPANRERLGEFRTLLDRWVRATDDRGRFPEDPAVVQYHEDRKREQFADRVAERRQEWDI